MNMDADYIDYRRRSIIKRLERRRDQILAELQKIEEELSTLGEATE